VCTGCQAEAHYGVPQRMYKWVGFASIAAGLVGGGATHSELVGVIAMFITLIGGIIWLKQRFKEHVEFFRRYRTR
jgi:hypothetical protein